jgi:hypothetical protein
VLGVWLSPDGRFCAAASSDGTLNLWRVGDEGPLAIFTLDRAPDWVGGTADGSVLVVKDGRGGLWSFRPEGIDLEIEVPEVEVWVDPLAEFEDQTIRFDTAGLLDERGFDDGLLLDDFMYDHEIEHTDFVELLVEVVRRLLVPRLDQDVTVERVDTAMLNPILASTIDGEPVGPGSRITPAYVDVSVADILRVADDMPRRR